MFARLKSLFRRSALDDKSGGQGLSAASQLKPLETPKAKKGGMSYPSFFTKTKMSDSKLPKADRRLATTDTLSFQNGTNTRKVIRDFVAASPDMSAAVWSYLRVGIPTKYTAVAMSAADGTFDVPATQLLWQLINRMNTTPGYDQGFSTTMSLKSCSEALARELIMYGALSGELVLDKSMLPSYIQPLSTTTIEFYPDGKGLRPIQRVGGEEIDLDTPCFIYISLDQDLLDAYAWSPVESAIKAVVFKEEFAKDILRIIKKVIHPRQKITIDEERFRKWSLSQEAQMDPEKANQELALAIASLEAQINGLEPEDALVLLDTVGFEVENPSNAGLASEYEVLQNIGNSRLSTGAKVMGTVLGFQSGSSNIASSETMLFMKSADGAVRSKLNEFYSRAFTLALRLMGLDVVVNFEYEPIDLRPENELLAFKQTKQMILLEQLSLGLITDEEACLALTGHLPPSGAPKLSGTMFKQTGAAGGANMPSDQAVNPSNGGSTMNQNLKSDQPATGRGQNKKADISLRSIQ